MFKCLIFADNTPHFFIHINYVHLNSFAYVHLFTTILFEANNSAAQQTDADFLRYRMTLAALSLVVILKEINIRVKIVAIIFTNNNNT